MAQFVIALQGGRVIFRQGKGENCEQVDFEHTERA